MKFLSFKCSAVFFAALVGSLSASDVAIQPVSCWVLDNNDVEGVCSQSYDEAFLPNNYSSDESLENEAISEDEIPWYDIASFPEENQEDSIPYADETRFTPLFEEPDQFEEDVQPWNAIPYADEAKFAPLFERRDEPEVEQFFEEPVQEEPMQEEEYIPYDEEMQFAPLFEEPTQTEEQFNDDIEVQPLQDSQQVDLEFEVPPLMLEESQSVSVSQFSVHKGPGKIGYEKTNIQKPIKEEILGALRNVSSLDAGIAHESSLHSVASESHIVSVSQKTLVDEEIGKIKQDTELKSIGASQDQSLPSGIAQLESIKHQLDLPPAEEIPSSSLNRSTIQKNVQNDEEYDPLGLPAPEGAPEAAPRPSPMKVVPGEVKTILEVPSTTKEEEKEGPAIESALGTPPGTKETQGFLINFNNVAITEYIRFISRITNRNFIFDDSEMQFNVTVVSEQPTSIDNIMAALLQELRIRGFSLIQQGNNLIIHSNPKANSPGKVLSEGEKASPDLEVETRVFTLTTLDAGRAAEIVKPMISAQAIVAPVQEGNNLIVTDISANVEKIAQLLKRIDSSTGGFEVGQYLVVNTVPDSLVALAERILAPLAQGKPLIMVPHNPTSSIYVVASPQLLQQAMIILKSIDISEGKTRMLHLQGEEGAESLLNVPGGLPSEVLERPAKWTSGLPIGHTESTQFYIHKVQYRRGDQIERALRAIAESLSLTGAANADLVITINSTQWIDSSNSLIFTGTKESLDKVKELIEEIDVPLRQVFMEMLILDTTVDESLNYSVEWGSRFGSPNFGGGQAFLNNATTSLFPGSLDLAGLAGSVVLDPQAGLTGRSNNGYNVGAIGRHVSRNGQTFNSIGALVNAVHLDSNSNIVLNPKILVEDNVAAIIFVGINAPFKTQSIANQFGTILTNNFEYRDIGTTLKVTPFLGNNDIITLEIEEEVSTIATSQGISSITGTAVLFENVLTGGPTTQKQKTSTRVHVPDNFFVVLSGMIQDQNSVARTQVPCLGGIPVIGALFTDKRCSDSKRNVMLFIRPHIVDTQIEYDEITKRTQDIFKEKCRSKNTWKYELDETLDFLNIETTDQRFQECP